jgi:cycloeucalenol cycloisomerase
MSRNASTPRASPTRARAARTPRSSPPAETARRRRSSRASTAAASVSSPSAAAIVADQASASVSSTSPAAKHSKALAPPAAAALSAAATSPTWFSSNAAKAGGERFFLHFAVAWIALMAVIVGTRAFVWFTPEHYLAVGLVIAVPCVLLPIAFPPAGEAHLPLTQRYTFKNNVWVAIVTFSALWIWQIYFYKVLCTRYSFSEGVYRINNVPVALFLITQGYFTLYHAASDMVLRAFARRFPRAPLVAHFVVLLAYCCVVAFAETFTIQNFEYYQIHDRWAMYTYGTAFYALYFVFTFPMHLGIDEEADSESGQQQWPLSRVVINAFAACGMVTVALELWRVSIGAIVANCPYPEASACGTPFIQ